jgi:Domain of unknown function (DUF6265)
MKSSSALISIVTVAALSWGTVLAQERKPARAGISGMAWLAGNWGGDGTPVATEERWTPAAGGAMLGVSRTIKGDRMVAFEFLRIIERDGGLVYIAQPNGRPPTEFALTSLAGQSATFENPAHDFPQDDSLLAEAGRYARGAHQRWRFAR